MTTVCWPGGSRSTVYFPSLIRAPTNCPSFLWKLIFPAARGTPSTVITPATLPSAASAGAVRRTTMARVLSKAAYLGNMFDALRRIREATSNVAGRERQVKHRALAPHLTYRSRRRYPDTHARPEAPPL